MHSRYCTRFAVHGTCHTVFYRIKHPFLDFCNVNKSNYLKSMLHFTLIVISFYFTAFVASTFYVVLQNISFAVQRKHVSS